MNSGCTETGSESSKNNIEKSQSSGTIKTSSETHNEQISSNQVKEDNDNSNKWLSILVVLLILLNIFILTVAVVSSLKRYPFKEKIITDLLENDRIKNLIKTQVTQQFDQNNMVKEKLISQQVISEKKLNEIVDEVVQRALECVNLELNISKEVTENTSVQIHENEKASMEIIYYRTKHGTILQEAVNEIEGVFKVFDIAENEAKFEYCGGAINPDFFIDICVFENNPQEIPDFTSIKTTLPGKVKKDNNGNWEIITTARIKFN
jgi:hypothetical protein